MARRSRKPTTTTTPDLEAAIESGKEALGKLDFRPLLGPVIDEYEALATANLPTPQEAIAACREAVATLGSENAHAGDIMAHAMGKLRKAYNRSMEQAGACIGRGDRKGAKRHLIEAEELEQTIKIIDAREPIKELRSAIKNVRVTVEGVAGTFPISGAFVGKSYVCRNGQFMRV